MIQTFKFILHFSTVDITMKVHRLSVMTFNMWQVGDYPGNWPQRRLPILECLTTFTPDILCVQELHSLFHEVIVDALSTHAYVQDDFPGWRYESNIYWNSNVFDMVEYGIVDIGMIEPLRRLFWVLLKIKTPEKSIQEQDQSNNKNTWQILVATAHYTWEGNEEECRTYVNLRKQQAQRTAAALHDLQSKCDDPHLAVLFMGDLNESFHPRRILREAGFIDCFSALRLPSLPTHPQRPSAPEEDILGDVSLDWIMQNNYARPILANVIRNMITTGGYSVSDHCPVMCIYEIGSGPYISNALQLLM
jgi:endonuclease/exonuclease/phosphatase family metal-dependent hydrolase